MPIVPMISYLPRSTMPSTNSSVSRRTLWPSGQVVKSAGYAADSKTVVERVLASMDSTEGALCSLDEHNSTITCLAKVGLEALPPNVAMKIGGASIANWSLLRRPLPVPPLGGLAKLFSNEQLHRF